MFPVYLDECNYRTLKYRPSLLQSAQNEKLCKSRAWHLKSSTTYQFHFDSLPKWKLTRARAEVSKSYFMIKIKNNNTRYYQLIHSKRLTFGFWAIKAGWSVSEHCLQPSECLSTRHYAYTRLAFVLDFIHRLIFKSKHPETLKHYYDGPSFVFR